MGNRGPQSFKKRQKEQQRKEKQQEKFAKRLERKKEGATGSDQVETDVLPEGPVAEQTELDATETPKSA